MDARRYRRPAAALVLAAALLGGPALAACDGGERPGALPSARPSAEGSAGRTTPTGERTTAAETTRDTDRTQAAGPDPTSGVETPTRETEPARTGAAEPAPTRATAPDRTPAAGPVTTAAEPARTQPAENPATQNPATQNPPTQNPPTQNPQTPNPPAQTSPPATPAADPATVATSTSPAVVPAASGDDGGAGAWGWILLLVLFAGLVGVLLLSRSRRVTVWDAEARGLAGETRATAGTRLPPVLTMAAADRRGLAWPPVRDDLVALGTRWAAQAQRAPDGDRQAYAGQIAAILDDLVAAVDAQNEAMAAGRDWRQLRPRPEAIVAALTAALRPAPASAAGVPGAPGGFATAPYAAPTAAPPETNGYGAPVGPPPASAEYGDPVERPPTTAEYGDPAGSPPAGSGQGRPAHSPRHAAADDGGPPPATTQYGEPIDDDPADSPRPDRSAPPDEGDGPPAR